MAKRWRRPLPRTGTSGTFSSTVASAGQQRGDWFGRTGFQRPCCAARAVSFGRESRSSSSLRRDVHLITTAVARRSSAIKSPGQRSDLWPGRSARGRPVGFRAWVKRRLGERRPACRPSHSCPRPPRPYGGPAQGTTETSGSSKPSRERPCAFTRADAHFASGGNLDPHATRLGGRSNRSCWTGQGAGKEAAGVSAHGTGDVPIVGSVDVVVRSGYRGQRPERAYGRRARTSSVTRSSCSTTSLERSASPSREVLKWSRMS